MCANSAGNLQVVTTPTFDWLSRRARGCRSRILIGSPYVNHGIAELTNLVDKNTDRTLVTRTDLRDFAMGASDLGTLCSLAHDGITIRSLSDFHAKVYIFDDKSALVTSANATFSGLHRNWECGLGTSDAQVVARLARSLLRGLGANRPPRAMTVEELEDLLGAVATIKASLPQPPSVPTAPELTPEPNAKFVVEDTGALLQGFKGWLRLTLRGVISLPAGDFHLEDLLSVCEPWASREYPRNHHVAAKLRQQLQILRDLGLVEFVDRGRYRRTVEI